MATNLPEHLNILNPPTLKNFTFHLFPELPTELRLQVWEEFMDHPRIITFDQESWMENRATHVLETSGAYQAFTRRWPERPIRRPADKIFRYFVHSSVRPSPLLEVNVEARKEAKRFYRVHLPRLGRPRDNNPLGPDKRLAGMMYLNPERDIVTLRETRMALRWPVTLVATLFRDIKTHEIVPYREGEDKSELEKRKVGILHLGLGFERSENSFLCRGFPEELPDENARYDLSVALARLKRIYIIRGYRPMERLWPPIPIELSGPEPWPERPWPIVTAGKEERGEGDIRFRYAKSGHTPPRRHALVHGLTGPVHRYLDERYFVPQYTDLDRATPDPRGRELEYSHIKHLAASLAGSPVSEYTVFLRRWGLVGNDLAPPRFPCPPHPSPPRLSIFMFEMDLSNEGGSRDECLSLVKSRLTSWKMREKEDKSSGAMSHGASSSSSVAGAPSPQKVFGFWDLTDILTGAGAREHSTGEGAGHSAATKGKGDSYRRLEPKAIPQLLMAVLR